MLPKEIAQDVELLRQQAVEASKAGEVQLAIDKLNAAWELLPETRTQWSEAFIITQYLVSLYLKCRDLESAFRMAQRLQDCGHQRQDIGEREYHLGRVQFERGDTDGAFRSFEIAHNKSDGRIWRLANGTQYQEFYKSRRKGK